MKIALFLALLALPGLAQAAAAQPCENFAKGSAIRAYKSATGTVQGSDGIQYSSLLIGQRGDVYTYLVTIADNNEDGETWEVDYTVAVRSARGVCSVLTVRKSAER